MTDLTIQHVFDVCEELETELFEQCENQFFQFIVTGTSFHIQVEFIGYPLWNSEDGDTRLYFEDSDTYEPLIDTLRRKFNELKEQLNTINL